VGEKHAVLGAVLVEGRVGVPESIPATKGLARRWLEPASKRSPKIVRPATSAFLDQITFHVHAEYREGVSFGSKRWKQREPNLLSGVEEVRRGEAVGDIGTVELGAALEVPELKREGDVASVVEACTERGQLGDSKLIGGAHLCRGKRSRRTCSECRPSVVMIRISLNFRNVELRRSQWQ
jgi:hypothetical protein